MNTLAEGQTPGDFMMFEEQAHYSRDEVTIGAGANLEPGTVLGQVTASKKYVAWDPTANDGSETAKVVLYTKAMAAEADVKGAIVIARHAQVRRGGLFFGVAASDEAQRDDACEALSAAGIQTI